MNREHLDGILEKGIALLVLLLLVIAPLTTGAVRAVDFFIVQFLGLTALALWIARMWVYPGRRILWAPVCWAVVLFCAYTAFRYLTADIEYAARGEFIKVFFYGLIFLLVLNNVYKQEYSLWFVYAMVCLGMILSFYAVYQFTTDSKYVWTFIKPDQYMGRGSGTFICPNHLAGFLEIVLPLGLATLFIGKISHLSRVLIGYASLVILAGIGVTISRGGWISTGVALAILFFILVRNRSFRLPAIAFLVLLIGGVTTFVIKTEDVQKRFESMVTSGKLENIRFKLWKPAYAIWQDNLWLGAGPAHFDPLFRKYRPEEVQMRPDRVHNDYLNTLADYGIIGFAMVGAAFVLLFMGVRKTWKYVTHSSNGLYARTSNRSAFVLGASAGICAILVHSFLDFNMHVPANALLVVVLMAFLSSHLRFTSDRYWHPLKLPARILITLILLFGICYIGWNGAKAAREDAWLNKAEQLEKYSPEQRRALLKAFEIEPMNYETAYEIGESYRAESWEAEPGYEDVAREAIDWFNKATGLNPFFAYGFLRTGMCLDWLNEHEKAEAYYQKALKLDPNGYYTVAHVGWHLVQKEDYSAAVEYFERSLALKPIDNPIAKSYLNISKRRIQESP
ncbi:MAG: O-antigen ligase family protein [Verrucomicrobia bacterium]|nr:O-antigen ligase family protein [Verrucomicrobiota bacterium]MCF7709037.1 O-antigen ligase family protein [Verrucomicrobiota bacterium]